MYSWGGITECLGRHPEDKDIDEIQFPRDNYYEREDVVITHIATGKNHVLALSKKNQVYAWGKNDFGQLGLGKIDWSIGYPFPWLVPKLSNIVQIYAGKNVSMAVTEKGDLLAWGESRAGILG